MNESDAISALAHLVAGTTGWNDESVDLYVDEMAAMADPEALDLACRDVVRTWTEARRPPLRTVIEAYRIAVNRKSDRQLTRAPHVGISIGEGLKIARARYEQYHSERGTTPNANVLRTSNKLSEYQTNNNEGDAA